MGAEIDKLKAALQAFGVEGLNIDGIVAELGEEVLKRLPPAVDADALTESVKARVSAELGAKLGEVLEAVKNKGDGAAVDTQGIIQGVAGVLQPKLLEAAKQYSDQALAANKEALLGELTQRLAEQFKQGSPQTGVGIGGTTIGGLFQMLMPHLAEIKEIVQMFRPPPGPEVQAGQLIGMSFRLADHINKLSKGAGDVQALGQEITNALAPPKKT